MNNQTRKKKKQLRPSLVFGSNAALIISIFFILWQPSAYVKGSVTVKQPGREYWSLLQSIF